MKTGYFITGLVLLLFHLTACQSESTGGPLRVSKENPRYFTDQGGKAIYLAGSHTWNNLVEMTDSSTHDSFDYETYLDFLESYNHNFFRLWTWNLLTWNTSGNGEENSKTLQVHPLPWLRPGPGLALDGGPRFDLTAFNPLYFQRLRERVKKADDRDIYLAVMLFDGWGNQFSPGAYQSHPFHPSNNIQNLPLALDDSAKLEIYTLAHEAILNLQEAYVEEVIKTVNAFDNVLYEISNENHPGSTAWQYHMIQFIKQTESTTGKSHPVGMTFQYRGGINQTLFESPADWISPNPDGGYRDEPPASSGEKLIITDTDHLWGIGGNRQWVWKSFFRGLNPIFMDPYDGKVLEREAGSDWAEQVRVALGNTRRIASKIDLLQLVPSGELSSSGYCLADPGEEYLVYIPDDQPVTIDLTEDRAKYRSTWFSTLDLTEQTGRVIIGGEHITLTSPFPEGEALVLIKH